VATAAESLLGRRPASANKDGFHGVVVARHGPSFRNRRWKIRHDLQSRQSCWRPCHDCAPTMSTAGSRHRHFLRQQAVRQCPCGPGEGTTRRNRLFWIRALRVSALPCRRSAERPPPRDLAGVARRDNRPPSPRVSGQLGQGRIVFGDDGA